MSPSPGAARGTLVEVRGGVGPPSACIAHGRPAKCNKSFDSTTLAIGNDALFTARRRMKTRLASHARNECLAATTFACDASKTTESIVKSCLACD